MRRSPRAPAAIGGVYSCVVLAGMRDADSRRFALEVRMNTSIEA